MQLFRLAGFLTPAQCVDIRRGMDAGEVEPAEVLAGGIQRDVQARLPASSSQRGTSRATSRPGSTDAAIA